MKIGLYNIDENIVNAAMMKVSTYYKSKGHEVEIYNHFSHDDYDKIYCFSIFDWSDKSYVSNKMVCGGTGFDIKTKLPDEIENCDYDWSLYPNCDFSIIWFSQGCIRNCEFCIVRQKEGYMHSVKPKNLNPNGKYIKVMDNNFFANPEWMTSINTLKAWNQPVDFQGVDVRILNNEMINSLNEVKHYKQIKIAWDNPNENIIPYIEKLISIIKPYKIMCYVLIGFNSSCEEDYYRIEQLRKLKIDPFIIPFNKKDKYQKSFARWVNHKAIFKSIEWKDYNGYNAPKSSENILILNDKHED